MPSSTSHTDSNFSELGVSARAIAISAKLEKHIRAFRDFMD